MNNVISLLPGNLKWTSAKESVATVDLIGNVTGVAKGSAQIIVTEIQSGKFASVNVSVGEIDRPFGTFKLIDGSNGAYTYTDDNYNTKVAGSVEHSTFTETFDGHGGGSATFDPGTGYQIFDSTINTAIIPAGSETFIYSDSSVISDGKITFGDGGVGWISADGNVTIGGQAVADGTYRQIHYAIGVKSGSNMDDSSLNGTFKVIEGSTGAYPYIETYTYFDEYLQQNVTVKNTKVAGYVSGGSFTQTFDGHGGCLATFDTGTEYNIFDSSISTGTIPGSSETCTYTVSSDGKITFGEGWVSWISENGDFTIGGQAVEKAVEDGGGRYIRVGIGVKMGSNMNVSSLNGAYKFFEEGTGAYIYTSPDGSKTVYKRAFGGAGTTTFDGLGGCTATYDSENSIRWTATTLDTASIPGGSETCTYTVASDGKITFGGGHIAWLSASGNAIISGQAVADGTSRYINRSIGVKVR